METTLKNESKVTVFENTYPGMAGEPIAVLQMTYTDGNKETCYVNSNLHLFEQNDREDIVKWLDKLGEVNHASAISFPI